MADSRCFVQFPHPGGEHKPDRSGGTGWSRRVVEGGCGSSVACGPGHARKFMQSHGQWVGEDDSTGSGELWAWGEWEAESDLLRHLEQSGDRDLPRYLWRPYYVTPPHGYQGLHNTDPFIFGEHLLYSNCRQQKNGYLKNLDRGSVIAFGSDRSGSWVLDAVLVVARSVNYAADDAFYELADSVPEAFLHVTAGPLTDNGAGARFRLYWGATPDNPVDGMFSFFPAARAGGDSGFKRPGIKLPSCCFTPNLRMAPKGTRDLSCEDVRKLWQAVATQVREAGLLLGTHLAVPERR